MASEQTHGQCRLCHDRVKLIREIQNKNARLKEKMGEAYNVISELQPVYQAARALYDNRLGWSDGRNPYAPIEFWEELGDRLSDHHTGANVRKAREGGTDGDAE